MSAGAEPSARETFLATERDATTRRRAFLFSFLFFRPRACAKTEVLCVACEERASVFEEIERYL